MSRRISLLVLAGVLAAFLSACTTTAPPPPPVTADFRNPALPVATRVNDLLAYMTLDEKLGQMVLAERTSANHGEVASLALGGVFNGVAAYPSPNTATGWADAYDALQDQAATTRLGIPLLSGADAVHGHNNLTGTTIYPHNIGMGATRDPALVQQVGRATAEEVAASGLRWTFAPCVCVVRNDRWGRSYESYGEVPEIASSMTTLITGLQGTALGQADPSIMATAKHFIADGGTDGGDDEGNATLTEAELRAIHLPPFQAAIQRHVGSIMVSYSSWNGTKMHANKYLITDVLKTELGFDGIVVSDYGGVDLLDNTVLFTPMEVEMAINAGIDMVMGPVSPYLFIQYAKSAVQNGTIAQSRIDDAVRRILTKKFQLGLFESSKAIRSLLPTVGSQAHRDLARQAVRESQVLLKNQGNVLPLPKSAKVFVAGKSADNIGYQSGGWTVGWQGNSGPITQGTTILDGIRQTVTDASQVTYVRDGVGVNGTYDAAIAVVGETPYAEYWGDKPGSMGLDLDDQIILGRLQAAGIPVIVVLVSGRPLNITAQLPQWRALLEAWLPGTEGRGVADVLFGDYKPTGTLPVTWMQNEGQQPINDGDGKVPLFPLGFGLTYP